MKKLPFVLLAVSAFTLCGCGKKLGSSDAVEFAKENFATSPKNATVIRKQEIKKNTGPVFNTFSDSTEKSEQTSYPVSALEISGYAEMGYDISTFAGKVYINYKLTDAQIVEALSLPESYASMFTGSVTEKVVLNKKGYRVKVETKYDVEINTDMSVLGINPSGVLRETVTLTYKY